MRRLDNIDLRLLRVFLTLAEAGSFADAQIALNLSQSTLSTHLATLERNLGGQLCVRGRRGFRLTPFGESVRTAAQELFTGIEAFQQKVGRDPDQLAGRLRIGIVDGVVTNPSLGLQTAIDRYMRQAANVFIDLELGSPHDLEQAIADGKRDIVIGPFSQKAPGIVYVPIHRELQMLFCGKGHPLFGVPQAKVTSEEIERSLFSVRGYRQLEDLYRVNHPKASARIIHMEAQAMLILSGHFLGFLPYHVGKSWVDNGLMWAVKPDAFQFASQQFAAYRKEDAAQNVIRTFLQELKRQAAPA